MSNDFVNHTWACKRCNAACTERFHLKTDGDPQYASPPAGWKRTPDGSILCPECTERVVAMVRRADAASRESRLAYKTLSPEAADARWRLEHICLNCYHTGVCRYAPRGTDLLVTVSACRAFKTSVDSDDGSI